MITSNKSVKTIPKKTPNSIFRIEATLPFFHYYGKMEKPLKVLIDTGSNKNYIHPVADRNILQTRNLIMKLIFKKEKSNSENTEQNRFKHEFLSLNN